MLIPSWNRTENSSAPNATGKLPVSPVHPLQPHCAHAGFRTSCLLPSQPHLTLMPGCPLISPFLLPPGPSSSSKPGRKALHDVFQPSRHGTLCLSSRPATVHAILCAWNALPHVASSAKSYLLSTPKFKCFSDTPRCK